MTNIKKSAIFMAFILIISSLTGCTSASLDTNSKNSNLSVVTTIFPPYDFARAVAGKMGDISMILPPGMESHSYEPTPSDIISIQECDIFIYAGGDSDAWVDDILASIDTSDIEIIKMTECVPVVEEEIKEGMQEHHHEHNDDHDNHDEHDDEDGEDHEDHSGHNHETDEHVWTSIRNSEMITQKICDTAVKIDPENSDIYKNNCKEYINEMNKLDNEFKEIVENAKRKELIFGDRFPIKYFVNDYGLDYRAAFVGCSSESEASAETVAYLIDRVRENNIPAVFHIEFSAHLIADTIADETGAKVVEFNTCHNVTKKQIESGVTYVDLMRSNIPAIEYALN